MVLPMIFDYIRSELAWRNAVLISAGVYFNICVMGVLMRPNLPRDVVSNGDDYDDDDDAVVVPFAMANLEDPVKTKLRIHAAGVEGGGGGGR